MTTRNRKKKLTAIILLLVLCASMIAFAPGCLNKGNKIFDTDLFHCMYNEDKTGVIILELTKKGQEQEILVIPEEINGLPVISISTVKGLYTQNYLMDSSKLKKLYIVANLNYIGENIFKSASEQTVVFIGSFDNTYITTSAFPSGTIFIVNNDATNLSAFDYHINNRNAAVKSANVIFFEKEDSSLPYWIDYVEAEGETLLPPNPTIEGKKFVGWYTQNGLRWEKEFVDFPVALFAHWE